SQLLPGRGRGVDRQSDVALAEGLGGVLVEFAVGDQLVGAARGDEDRHGLLLLGGDRQGLAVVRLPAVRRSERRGRQQSGDRRGRECGRKHTGSSPGVGLKVRQTGSVGSQLFSRSRGVVNKNSPLSRVGTGKWQNVYISCWP